jgi:hypothetical protein
LKKTKIIILVILGILFFIPFIRISNAQGSYVGIQNGDEFEWELNVHTGNWNTYFSDDLADTLGNLVPLGSIDLSRVFSDWSWDTTPPQSLWQFTVTAIDVEEAEKILLPDDNTTITYTPVSGTFNWINPVSRAKGEEWDYTRYIVNDTSSFLRQTLFLHRSFSPYALMFYALFAPTTVSWSSFISDFQVEMSSRGGLYDNISTTAQLNGFLINIPALGFENNSVAIDINCTYNSNGVLSYYEFSYGGQTLVDFTRDGYVYVFPVPKQYIYIFFGLTAIFVVEIILYLYMRRRRK